MKKNANNKQLNSANSPESRIYKHEEFEEFVKILEEGAVENWSIIAQALGVDTNTIVAWRKHPSAKKAIAEGIRQSVNNMEIYGKRDWRMWREKAKMLGVSEVIRNEHGGEGGGPVKLEIEITESSHTKDE